MEYLKNIISARAEWTVASILGAINAFFMSALERWINFALNFDAVFIINLVSLVTIDTVLGTLAALKERRASSNKFGKVFYKVLLYSIVLYATHAAAYSSNESYAWAAKWVDNFMYSSIAFRELFSIIENMQILGIIKLPNNVVEKLEAFQKTQEKPKQ